MTQKHYIVGVDEVGRGPVAGPVCVCAAVVENNFDFNKYFPELNDSKAISEKKRNSIFEEASKLKEEGVIKYSVSYESAEYIDNFGISTSIKKALKNSIDELELKPKDVFVFLDGGLKIEEVYEQETIVRGDSLVPIISLASVIAKVSRDSLMAKECEKYPEYGFSRHKGYGTKAHMEAIKKHGPSPIHRSSFLGRVLGEYL